MATKYQPAGAALRGSRDLLAGALRQEFLEAFKKVDVFICPTLPFTATKVGAMKVVIENGVEEDMLSAIMQFTGVPRLTGLPSLNVPPTSDRPCVVAIAGFVRGRFSGAG